MYPVPVRHTIAKSEIQQARRNSTPVRLVYSSSIAIDPINLQYDNSMLVLLFHHSPIHALPPITNRINCLLKQGPKLAFCLTIHTTHGGARQESYTQRQLPCGLHGRGVSHAWLHTAPIYYDSCRMRVFHALSPLQYGSSSMHYSILEYFVHTILSRERVWQMYS